MESGTSHGPGCGLGPDSWPGSITWIRLIATSQALPALLQEAFLTYQTGSGLSSGPMPMILTHLGLWLLTTDLRAKGTRP